jgi:hypothetical protein
MNASMTSDLSRFRTALANVALASRKPHADIVNKALKDTAFRSAQFTPKTTAAKVRSSLPKEMLFRMAAKHLKEKQGKYTKAELRATAAKIAKRRRSGIGGVRAGWIPAILALGGTYRGAQSNPSGSAAKGTAHKAKESQMAGLIRNAVVTTQFSTRTNTGAGNIPFAVDALRQAIVFVTNDRNAYAERKAGVSKVLSKYSDK